MTASPSYRGLYAYAWDVAEEDADRFVGELRGLSIDTLCLAASYHAGKFIRPHGKTGHVHFPEDGKAHCHVRPERYGKIKPEESGIVGEGDPFGRYAERADIAVTAWTVLLHNTNLGMKHPDAVVRNAFGDPYHYSLCPANPDVRAYAVALATDIAERYPIRGLALETPGFLPYRHGYHHEFALIGANPWLDLNLGLCFCSHCRAGATKAGIAVDALQARIAGRIQGYLAAPLDTPPEIGRAWLEADLLLDADLGAYLRWRCDTVTSLVREIRQSVRADAELFIIPSIQQPNAAAWSEGSDLNSLAGAADGLELCLYQPGWKEAVGDLGEVRRRVGDGARLRCIMRPAPPDFSEEGAFAQTVAALHEAGMRDFAFYNYGHIRRSHLDWIGRAFQDL